MTCDVVRGVWFRTLGQLACNFLPSGLGDTHIMTSPENQRPSFSSLFLTSSEQPPRSNLSIDDYDRSLAILYQTLWGIASLVIAGKLGKLERFERSSHWLFAIHSQLHLPFIHCIGPHTNPYKVSMGCSKGPSGPDPHIYGRFWERPKPRTATEAELPPKDSAADSPNNQEPVRMLKRNFAEAFASTTPKNNNAHLLESGSFSDLAIECNGWTFNVHCAVLCPQSEFFSKACGSGLKVNLN